MNAEKLLNNLAKLIEPIYGRIEHEENALTFQTLNGDLVRTYILSQSTIAQEKEEISHNFSHAREMGQIAIPVIDFYRMASPVTPQSAYDQRAKHSDRLYSLRESVLRRAIKHPHILAMRVADPSGETLSRLECNAASFLDSNNYVNVAEITRWTPTTGGTEVKIRRPKNSRGYARSGLLINDNNMRAKNMYYLH